MNHNCGRRALFLIFCSVVCLSRLASGATEPIEFTPMRPTARRFIGSSSPPKVRDHGLQSCSFMAAVLRAGPQRIRRKWPTVDATLPPLDLSLSPSISARAEWKSSGAANRRTFSRPIRRRKTRGACRAERSALQRASRRDRRFGWGLPHCLCRRHGHPGQVPHRRGSEPLRRLRPF